MMFALLQCIILLNKVIQASKGIFDLLLLLAGLMTPIIEVPLLHPKSQDRSLHLRIPKFEFLLPNGFSRKLVIVRKAQN